MDVFFLLLFGHALADFGLQSTHMIEHKNRHRNPDTWYIYLAAHAVMHGGFVGFFTGSFALAILETIAHAAIDYAKCDGKFTLKIDQLLHIGCKGLWMILLMKGLV